MCCRLKFLNSYIKIYWFRFLLQFLGTIVTSVAVLIFPYLYALLIDSVFYSKDISKLGSIILTYGVIFLTTQFIYLPMNINWAFLETKFLFLIRKDIFYKVMSLPAKLLDDNEIGNIISIISNDSEEVMNLIVRNGFQQIANIIVLFISLFYIFNLSFFLGCIVLLIIPSNYFILNKLKKYIKCRYQKYIEIRSKSTSFVYELLLAIEDIKIFNLYKIIGTKFLLNEKKLIKEDIIINKYDLFAERVNVFISLLIKVFIFLIVIINKSITIGSFIACMEYYEKCIIVFSSISKKFIDASKNLTALDRIIRILNMDYEKSGEELIKNINSIKFYNVSFGYDSTIIINNINFEINEGEKVAIVGRSGEGKTTIINLLLKFYEATTGEIHINNINISNISNYEYRKQIGVVLQNSALFDESIRYNLSLGNFYDDCVLYDVLKKVDLFEFIYNLPCGLETRIGKNGVSLSGGQRQRLCIARIMLRDPMLFILDEPTSSLDDISTNIVTESILKSINGILIVIAHNINTIKLMDKIIYIENGKISGIGNHRNLFDDNKGYRELFMEKKSDEENI